MKRKLLTCLFSILILFIYIALPANGFAQSVPQQFLQVSPIIQDITLTPGTTFSYPLTITNKGDKPVGFHIDITDIDPVSDVTFDTSKHLSPLVAWTEVSPKDLIVPPLSKNSFTVTITTPQNAKNSGYYATLYLTPFISNPLKSSGPVILERIGSVIFATVGKMDYKNLSQKTHIKSFGFIQPFLGAPTAVTFQVDNTYFTHFTAKPRLSITSTNGTLHNFFLEEKHILPGSTRTWTYPIHVPWYTLYMQANVVVSIGNGYQLSAQNTFVNYSLLIKLVLGVCLLLFSLKRHRQIRNAIRILLTGHSS